MEEMMEDTLEMNEDEEIEEEADEEVDKVLAELTGGKLGQVGTVGHELPVRGYCIVVAAIIANTLAADQPRADRRSRDRADHGTISTAAQRLTVIMMTAETLQCIHFAYCSSHAIVIRQLSLIYTIMIMPTFVRRVTNCNSHHFACERDQAWEIHFHSDIARVSSAVKRSEI
jgi:hypothetical protein